MNFYYSVMSIYGWWNWSRKKGDKYVVPISRTTTKEKLIGLVFFVVTMIITYVVYRINDYDIQLVNYIDIFTSGIFFTAMWFMANKKLGQNLQERQHFQNSWQDIIILFGYQNMHVSISKINGIMSVKLVNLRIYFQSLQGK